MTESERVFIDTAPIIYLLEDDPNFGAAAAAAFQKLILSESRLYTSAVTCEEYLVYAYRGENPVLERAFFSFLSDFSFTVADISQETAKKAAQIRARYVHFKAMDALQLASACESGCSLFLTNDRQLLSFDELKCVMIKDFITQA